MEISKKVVEIRQNRDKASFIHYFEKEPEKIEELFQLVKNLDPYPLKEYASWTLIHLMKSGKFKLQHLYDDLVDLTFQTSDQTVLRNVVCCIHHLTVTSYRESAFIDQLINFVKDYNNKVALQVYSIYVLIQFCKRYPELATEIDEIIEFHSRNKTAAYNIAQRNFRNSLALK